jgi:hypothetical protein
MVDSKNSTTRHLVSRRKLLTGAATVPLFSAAVSASREPFEAPVSIMKLWQEWQRLRARATDLCHRWQDIETHLMRTIGVPQVLITSPDNSADVRAQSHVEIDLALARFPRSCALTAALHADFANQQARWDAEATRLGFDEIKQQEDAAWNQEAEGSAAIFSARATSLAGIEIKIALLVELCSTGSDDPEFPLPQLCSTLADMKRLRRKFGAIQC